tara:strand:- start:31557 stop:32363 length:807 start_codon:yes stop_codon:yes gene_type:complete
MHLKKPRLPIINQKEAYKFIKSLLKIDLKGALSKNPLFIEKNIKPYEPEIFDLYFLYKLITLNKRLTILEFGSGWSTLIMALAMEKNIKDYRWEVFEKNQAKKKMRFQNPFEIFSVDNEKKYMKISKNRIDKIKIKSKVNFIYSPVQMTKFEGRICTEYKELPLCNPDFIFLDAPDQFNIKGKINGITISHDDYMPMSCDILKIEFFLKPGTIICVDGRAANVKFLKSLFKRNWIQYYVSSVDMYILYLDSSPLGAANKKQLKFYNSL